MLILDLKGLTLILHFSLFILHFSMLYFQNGGHRLAIGGYAADAVLPLAAGRQPRGLPLPPLLVVKSLEIVRGMADSDTEARCSVIGIEARFSVRGDF